MRHFNYFENGGPAPSACLSCGANKRLFDLGREIPVAGGMAQLCLTCATELALAIGYAEAKPLQAVVDAAKTDVAKLEADLAKVPNLVDGLINGIRSSVTDFIFAVSYSDSTDKPELVQDSELAGSGDDESVKKSTGQRKAPIKSVSE